MLRYQGSLKVVCCAVRLSTPRKSGAPSSAFRRHTAGVGSQVALESDLTIKGPSRDQVRQEQVSGHFPTDDR